MSKFFEIPLSPKAQKFKIALGGETYRMSFFWNPFSNCWILDIADRNEVPLVSGIPVITGVDLLAQYRYLGFTGHLVVQTDHDTNAVPTSANLGLEGHVYFAVRE